MRKNLVLNSNKYLKCISASWQSVLLLIILLATFFALFRIYAHAGLPYTHDGDNHVARFADYAAAVRQGQIPPQIAPNIWSQVGYPVFIFNYPLSNILSLPFTAIDIAYIHTFKILMVLYTLLGGVGVWLWLRRRWGIESALVGLLAWLSFPYLVNLIYFRGSIGEVSAYALLPWLFLAVDLVKQRGRWGWLLASLTTMLMLLAHNTTAMIVWLIIVPYSTITFGKDRRLWFTWAGATFLGALATAWFWLPALVEKSYVVLGGATNNTQAVLHSPTLASLLWSPLRFGFSYVGSVDSVSFWLGALPLVVLLILIQWRLILRQPGKSELLFFVIVGLLLVLLQITPFASIWSLPLLGFIQFPWRVSILLGFVLAVLTAALWHRGGGFSRLLVVCFYILYLLFLFTLHPADFVYKTDADYASFPGSTTTQNENQPLTFKGFIGQIPAFASLHSGAGTVEIIQWLGHLHVYTIDLQTESGIVENTLLFPGWTTTATNLDTGISTKVDLKADCFEGWICYSLPTGTYHIETVFNLLSWDRIAGYMLSVSALISMSVLLLFTLRSAIKSE